MADNVVLGTGRLYVAKLGSDGVPGPERYLGDSAGASLAGGEGERLTIFAGDGADRSKKLVDKVLDVNRTMSLTLRDISFANLEMFLIGDLSEVTPAAVAAASPEQFPACVAGDEFQVGAYVAGSDGGYAAVKAPASDGKIGYTAGDSGNAAEDAAAAKKVLWEPTYAGWLENGEAKTSSAKDGAGGATATDATAEVVVFGDVGRVRVVAASLSSGFRLSYPAQAEMAKVVSATEQDEVAVRYVEHDPFEGAGRSVYVTKATISANGEWQLKQRDTEQQLGLTVSVLGKVVVTAGAS